MIDQPTQTVNTYIEWMIQSNLKTCTIYNNLTGSVDMTQFLKITIISSTKSTYICEFESWIENINGSIYGSVYQGTSEFSAYTLKLKPFIMKVPGSSLCYADAECIFYNFFP